MAGATPGVEAQDRKPEIDTYPSCFPLLQPRDSLSGLFGDDFVNSGKGLRVSFMVLYCLLFRAPAVSMSNFVLVSVSFDKGDDRYRR